MTSEHETAADVEAWQALVAAEQHIAKLRAAVHRLPHRTDILTKALSDDSGWDRPTALTFLRDIPVDTPLMLDQLVDLALSVRWARQVKDAIRAARTDIDPTRMTEVVNSFLAEGDAEDYLRLAEMASETESWEALGAVIEAAAASEDPEKHEVAREFTDMHGSRIRQ